MTPRPNMRTLHAIRVERAGLSRAQAIDYGYERTRASMERQVSDVTEDELLAWMARWADNLLPDPPGHRYRYGVSIATVTHATIALRVLADELNRRDTCEIPL